MHCRYFHLAAALVVCAPMLVFAEHPAPAGGSRIVIDYPLNESVFPPEFPAPAFLWRDENAGAAEWMIDIAFADGSAALRIRAAGTPMSVGQIDRRCVGPNNQLPKPAAGTRTWVPDAQTWSAIKGHRGARIAIANNRGGARAQVSIVISKDRVDAPIFYRDVPLLPSETEKGVIKPLAAGMFPLVGFRLRNVDETRSRLLLEGIHTCANCHSFSRDGKTMGMDVDGPQNDKGLYAIVPVQSAMAIRNQDVVAWSGFRGKLGSKIRVGFMSQVSPEGRYVVTTIDDTAPQGQGSPPELAANYYVANFKDYRFLQVFYPTRGILAWYDRRVGKLQPLPGADDPRYVHTNAVWSPDGKYLVFSRALAKDAYAAGSKPAARANDLDETEIKYDLYRIPFNDGRGGRAEPIAGAAANGMSNSFAKISPDGRWIVFVQARNGQLMRPDSRLYIVPADGGRARPMRCNTPLMNSWHSFSPNGRWMVFSSKSRSPYTQMFLTHIDSEGNDSPAILIENATAANRAVNIPEFINAPRDGIAQIEAPVTDYYRIVDSALELAKARRYEAAIAEWKKAAALDPAQAMVYFNLGNALFETRRIDEAIAEYQRALEIHPDHAEAHNNLGNALGSRNRPEEAVLHYKAALRLKPGHCDAQANLGAALVGSGSAQEAIPYLRGAIQCDGKHIPAHVNLAIAMAVCNRLSEAVAYAERAVKLSEGRDAMARELLAKLRVAAARERGAR